METLVLNYHSGDFDVKACMDVTGDKLVFFVENKRSRAQYNADVKKEDFARHNVIKSSRVLFDMLCDVCAEKDVPVEITCREILVNDEDDDDDIFCYTGDMDDTYQFKGEHIIEYDGDAKCEKPAFLLSVCYKPIYCEEYFRILMKLCSEEHMSIPI